MGICGSNAKVACTPKRLEGQRLFPAHQAHVVAPLKENNSICSKNTQPKDAVYPQGNASDYQIIGFFQPQDHQGNHFNRNTTENANNTIVQHVQSPLLNERRQLAFKKGHMVDRGSYGEVFQSLDVNTGQLYAIKTIKKLKPKAELDEEVKQLQVEIEQFHNLQHLNVVKFIACELDEDERGINIISEYISGGSIRQMLEKFGKFNENVVSIYTRQVLLGLQYLHANNVLHRDIKGGNILIDTDGTIKLTDFGTLKAHKQDAIMQISSSLSSLPLWTSPELLAGESQQSSYSDVWSVGCLVIEMLTGLPPYADLHRLEAEEIRQHIIDGNRPALPGSLSAACQEFLDQTLQVDPLNKSTVDELLQLPFVKDREIAGSIAEQTSPNYTRTGLFYSQSSLGMVAGYGGGGGGGGIADSQQLSQIGSSSASQAYFPGEHGLLNHAHSRIFGSRNEIALQGGKNTQKSRNAKDEPSQQVGNKLPPKVKHSKKETLREARGEYQHQLISQLKESQDAENLHSISSRSLSSVQYSSGIRGQQQHQLEEDTEGAQAQRDVEDEILELIKNKKKKKAAENAAQATPLNSSDNLGQNNQGYRRDLQIQVVFNNPKDFFRPLKPEETIGTNEVHLKKFCNDIQDNSEEYDGNQNILEQPLKEQDNDDDEDHNGDVDDDNDNATLNKESEMVIEEIEDQKKEQLKESDYISQIDKTKEEKKEGESTSDLSQRQRSSGKTHEENQQNILGYETSSAKEKETYIFEVNRVGAGRQNTNASTNQADIDEFNMISRDINKSNHPKHFKQEFQGNSQIQKNIPELQFGEEYLLTMLNEPTSTRTYMSINQQLQGSNQEQELYNYTLEVVDIS